MPSMATMKYPKSKDANIRVSRTTGLVHYEVRLKRPDGTEFRRNGIAKDENEARKKRDQAYAEFNRDHGRSRESQTIKSFADHCLESVWPNEHGEKTLADYDHVLRLHILPTLGGIKVSELNAEQAQLFLNHLQKKGAGKATLQKVKTVLSSLMTRAVRNGAATSNPVRMAKIREESRKHVVDVDLHPDKRILTPSERTKLMKAARGSTIETAVFLSLWMGLRAGECLGLTWNYVDLGKRRIRIRQQAQRIRQKGLMIVPPKTKASHRDLPIPKNVYEHLLKVKETSKSPYLVPNEKGTIMEPSRLRHGFDRLCLKAEIVEEVDANGRLQPKPTFHDLRSSYLTMMANERRVEYRELMQLAGHASVEITMQYYVRASDDALAAAILGVGENEPPEE